MVYKNLELYLARLRGDAPVFVVDAVLSATEVVTSPPVKEIYKLLTQSVRDTVESVRRFVRWMHGTCIECAPQHVEGRDEPYVFSFQKDIQVHPRVLDVVSQLNMTITQFLGGVNKYLTRWRNKYKVLWRLQKGIILEKIAAKKLSCVKFDSQLQFYTNMAIEVNTMFYY